MGETNKSPEFLAKFPIGKVPALETHSATPFYISEAAAIAYFVADSGQASAQLLGATTEERAKIQQFIYHSENEIYPAVLPSIRVAFGIIPFDEKVDTENKAALGRVLKGYEARLGDKKWLATEENFSLADLTNAGVLYIAWKSWLGKEFRDPYPNLVAWYLRLLEVPEVKEVFGAPEFKE